MSATKETIGEEQQKSWNEMLFETKLNLFRIQYLNAINEELEKVDCSSCNEYQYLENISYCDGLRKAIRLFTELKNKENGSQS